MSIPQIKLTGETETPTCQYATPELNQHVLATDQGYKSRWQAIQRFSRKLLETKSLLAGVTHISVVIMQQVLIVHSLTQARGLCQKFVDVYTQNHSSTNFLMRSTLAKGILDQHNHTCMDLFPTILNYLCPKNPLKVGRFQYFSGR